MHYKEYRSASFETKNNYNNHSIKFSINDGLCEKFGIIQKFFEINGVYYCLVKELQTENFRNMTYFDIEKKKAAMKLNFFFKKFKFTNNFILIEFELVQTKCITLSLPNQNFLSTCVDLNEHD
jgi:hypothetical protein